MSNPFNLPPLTNPEIRKECLRCLRWKPYFKKSHVQHVLAGITAGLRVADVPALVCAVEHNGKFRILSAFSLS
jgi:hypothetical protein